MTAMLEKGGGSFQGTKMLLCENQRTRPARAILRREGFVTNGATTVNRGGEPEES
jgi:hypothetical protein